VRLLHLRMTANTGGGDGNSLAARAFDGGAGSRGGTTRAMLPECDRHPGIPRGSRPRVQLLPGTVQLLFPYRRHASIPRAA